MSSNHEVARDYSKHSSLEQGKCFDILLSKMTFNPGDQCLDIGCGTGNPTAIVARKVGVNGQVLGVDLDKERIRIARKTHPSENIKFLEGKFSDIELEESMFDLVFSNLVYHWLNTEEKLKSTKKAFSVVKRNGLFVASISKERIENAKEILRYFPKERQDYVDDLLSYQSDQYYKELFMEAGFDIVSFSSEVIEAAFPSVQSYLEWMDASYGLKNEFKTVYYENEHRIKLSRYADGTVCQKTYVLFVVLRKP